MIRASTAAGPGVVIQAGLCAPRRFLAMNGPSRWTPRTRAPTGPAAVRSAAVRSGSGRSGANPAARRSAATVSSIGLVIQVGRNAVVPVSGSRRATSRQPGSSASPNRPEIAVYLQVDEAGQQDAFGELGVGEPGGGPDPTASPSLPRRRRTRSQIVAAPRPPALPGMIRDAAISIWLASHLPRHMSPDMANLRLVSGGLPGGQAGCRAGARASSARSRNDRISAATRPGRSIIATWPTPGSTSTLAAGKARAALPAITGLTRRS